MCFRSGSSASQRPSFEGLDLAQSEPSSIRIEPAFDSVCRLEHAQSPKNDGPAVHEH